MQLILFLLVAVSILTLLSGIAVLSGAKKGERLRASIFFFTTIFSLLWAVSIGVFLLLPKDTSPEIANATFYVIYISAAIMSWGLMSYTCHKTKLGKIGMVILGLICAALIIFILNNPYLMYSSIELNENTGNIVHLHQNLFYGLYGAYFCIAVGLYMVGLLYAAHKAKFPNIKKANIMVFIGFTITGVIALIFDLILPVLGYYSTIWIGPLAMCIAWVFHYYAILRYRLIDLSGRWLQTLSHVIIMSLAAIVYLSIFFIVFIALFKVPSPSTEVIILTSIMVAIVLLLTPVLNEISDYIRSLTSPKGINTIYILKKLNTLSKGYINYHELAAFLGEHLRYQYFGLIIDKKVYNAGNKKITSSDLARVATLKHPSKTIWLEFSDAEKSALKKLGIESIALLKDPNGEIVGKALFGRPADNHSRSHQDLRPIEEILTLTASVICAEKERDE